MKQLVNSPQQQFYSFDNYIVDNGLEDYFHLSTEFNNFNSDLWAEKDNYENGLDNDDFYNVTAKQKNRRRVLARILTGGLSVVAESKAQRKETNAQIKSDTKKAAKVASNVFRKSIFGVPLLAYIGLLRVNMAKQAARLYPGLLTEKEAREKGYDIANWKKTVQLIAKVKKALEKLGGAREKDKKLFRDALRLGHDKPPFRSKKRAKVEKAADKKRADLAKANDKNFVSIVGENEEWFNYEGIWEAAAVAAGSAVLGIIANLISKSGVKKNPYADGKVHPGLEGEDEDVPEASPDQQKEAMAALIEQNPDYTPEEKKAMLADLDGAVDYLNSPSAKKDITGGTDDLLLYGGIAIGVIAISTLLYFSFKPKQ